MIKRYGVALALASLAVLVRGALPIQHGTAVYELSVAAVVVGAWFGGRGPGWFALLLCAAGVDYWLIPPVHSFTIAPEYVFSFCLFIGLCILLIEFSAGRWRAARALEESDRRFRLMADSVSEMLWIESITPRAVLYMSPRYEQIWGCPPGDLKHGREFWIDGVHPEDGDDVRFAWKRWLSGEGNGRLDVTFRIVRPDGETRWIHSRGTLIRDEQGKPYRGSGLAEDITEEKRAQEALAKAQAELARVSRLTTLGELTTSIAHEVGQPLGAMIARAAAGTRWLAAEPPNIAEARASLDNIAADGNRARQIIGRIRALTKRQPPRKDLLDVNHKIREVLAFAEHELRSHDIFVRTQLDSPLPRVAGDGVQLQQVLLNLILNAMEAMGGVDDRPRELTIVSGPSGANAVLVEVRDSGIGLGPADGAERLFEAFYTTKTEGLGIGLSISRSIVEAHGGRLWASPNEPHGAVFRFSLPVAKDGQS